MKTKIISKTLLSLGLVFVLVSAITQVRGQGVVTIHSIGDVTRGQTGSFVVNMNPAPPWVGIVNFSVSGTAVLGVDYAPLISPAYIGQSGYGVISFATLPDPRAQSFHQAYSVVVTLKPGLGYALGEQK